MPQPRIYFEGESEESDFSETDMSIRGRNGRTAFHRRSVSRHRQPEAAQDKFLAPVQQSTRVFRSASTGGRRPRERDNTPAVMIVNEQATRTSNANTNKPRRVQQTVYDESDEEVHHPSRRRAASGISREASPLQQQRDYELLMGQRMLEKSDFHQDMEIWKHQQEIERLERELERTREKSTPPRQVAAPVAPPPPPARESRLLRDEEEWYEDEISDRLRRLQRFERKNRAEEERRQAEHRWRLQKFEEAEREAANKEELKAKLRAERLKEIERQQEEEMERERIRLEIEEQKMKEVRRAKEEEAERERLKKKILEEEARKAEEAAKEKERQLALKAAAVEEWKLEQERLALKRKEDAAKKDFEFRERLRVEFGYSEEEIEKILKKKEKEEKDETKLVLEETKKTTWIKVCLLHLFSINTR